MRAKQDENCCIETLELMIDDIVCNINGRPDTSCNVQVSMNFETWIKPLKKAQTCLLMLGADLNQNLLSGY